MAFDHRDESIKAYDGATTSFSATKEEIWRALNVTNKAKTNVTHIQIMQSLAVTTNMITTMLSSHAMPPLIPEVVVAWRMQQRKNKCEDSMRAVGIFTTLITFCDATTKIRSTSLLGQTVKHSTRYLVHLLNPEVYYTLR
jgi:hypothetical protein